MMENDAMESGPGVAPELRELEESAQARLVHFIVTATLAAGAPPIEVAALYADLAGDEQAIRYADERFTHRRTPPGWRDVEDRVFDLDEAARARGVDLGNVWQGATEAALESSDPLAYLARLAGLPVEVEQSARRSIFDDPEDLEDVGDDAPGLDESQDEQLQPLQDREPDLRDLETGSQRRIRRFAIEERLEGGLPPFELLELYRQLEIAEDERARQYLDRVFLQRDPPADWLDLQARARQVREIAAERGKDAARIYVEVIRSAPGADPSDALERTRELILSSARSSY